MIQPVADQSWAKKLFFCSQRQPINNVAFRFKEVLLSQPLNKTIIPISGCIADHSMLRGIYMLLWDTNSLRDNLQTAADVKNKRGPASLFPYIYLIDSYNTSFGVHLTSLGKANLFLAFHLSLALVPSCFTHWRAGSSYSFIAKGTPLLPPGEKLV